MKTLKCFLGKRRLPPCHQNGQERKEGHKFMMKWVFAGLLFFSLVFGIINGDVAAVSDAALSEAANAVTLCLTLCAVICLWSGIMRVAQTSGLANLLAKAFKPVLVRLFKGINPNGKAIGFIVLNITANLLGLGNASTPFGIAAMRELEKEEGVLNPERATNNMVLFVVINTASLQLIPTTAAAIRLKHGSAAPMEILPVVWICSLAAVTVAVTIAKLLGSRGKRHCQTVKPADGGAK
ncbi:MAG: spore maturation protein A [Oscillospiraceae bacterium]|nr:spore maturation protein A [Oscillospiraceae bacterium]